ncbi:MAG: glycosyltransferase family 4 protein [Rhodocyclales bacterium]|nr:glycosyltransferase family 4 protein [Rhodocyclales bacterium]
MSADILFLPVSGPRGASSRYRIFQFLPAIEAAGYSHRIHLPPTGPGQGLGRIVTAWRDQRAIRKLAALAQLSFVQKRLLPERLVAALARSGRLMFDFDDAIFTSPTGDRSVHASRRVERRLQAVLAAADVVLTGNRYLAEYSAPYARHVTVLPTVVDTDRYPARQHGSRDRPVIGWIGHSVNHPYLAAMQPLLQRLAATQKFSLLIVSDKDLLLPGIEVENRRWSEATEVADILDMDIGIMPMPDDPWSRGKCGLKALQYMAAGVPVVCAAVGANVDIVRNGIDGFAASGEADWQEGLGELCASAELRAAMGTSARARVAAEYSIRSATPILLQQIESTIGSGSIEKPKGD